MGESPCLRPCCMMAIQVIRPVVGFTRRDFSPNPPKMLEEGTVLQVVLGFRARHYQHFQSLDIPPPFEYHNPRTSTSNSWTNLSCRFVVTEEQPGTKSGNPLAHRNIPRDFGRKGTPVLSISKRYPVCQLFNFLKKISLGHRHPRDSVWSSN